MFAVHNENYKSYAEHRKDAEQQFRAERDQGWLHWETTREALDRGVGPAPVGTTQQGVNGLYDMGANVWEWVNSESVDSKVTAGGSWWYEAFRMHRDDRAVKPRDTAVVYIGFRCATDVR